MPPEKLEKRSRRSPVEAVEFAEELEVFAGAHLAVDGEFLRHDADEPANVARGTDDRLAEQAHRAVGRLEQAGKDRQQRGLAGTIGAEEAEDFSFADLESDSRESLERAVALVQIDDVEKRIRHAWPLMPLS